MLVLIALSMLTAAPAGRPSLSGRVLNGEGEPIQGALVFVATARPRQGTSTTCPSCYLDCRKRTSSGAAGRFVIPSLDPSLLFEVGATAEGYGASFARSVDPAAGPVTLTLTRAPAPPADPRRQVRGRLVDPDGRPIAGARIDPVGYQVEDGPARSGRSTFGAFGASPAVTGERGQFLVVLPVEADSLYVDVEAQDLAPRRLRVSTGVSEHAVRVGRGRMARGRITLAGRPVANATVGAAQRSRDAETFVGERTAETDSEGRFVLRNLPPDEPLVLYGKVGGMGGRAALSERELAPGPDGSFVDLGELGADAGFEVRGRVVLADGRPVPPKTRVRIDRLHAWDGVEVELSPAGELRVGGLPRETVELSIRVPGYELSPDQVNLLPDAGDSRTTLAGRLVRDTDLRIVLVPAAERAPAFPQTPEGWAELEARQEAVRARELAGAPPAE